MLKHEQKNVSQQKFSKNIRNNMSAGMRKLVTYVGKVILNNLQKDISI
jgi:hypothetical protein